MQWRPTQKNTSSLTVLMILTGLIAAVGYIAGNMADRFTWLFQLICIGGIVAMLYLLVRYHMTWFVYSIRTKSDKTVPGIGTVLTEDMPMHITHLPKDMLDFAVVRGQGRKNGVLECLLGLEQLVRAIPVSEKSADGTVSLKDARKKYPGMALYDYTITLFRREALLLVFLDGERYVGILIEAGEDMQYYLTHLQS
ncbi:MAG: hypothetical protein IJ325_06835 [Clostridia bacterium]|nr:hypothetical protein [Clostridia bacterium]